MAGENLEDNYLCCDCVSENYLSAQIKKLGKHRKCATCGARRPTYSLGEVADLIEQAFKDHYVRTSDQPDMWQDAMLRDRESDYVWYREGQPVIEAIAEAAGVDESVATDLREILDERQGYVDPSDPQEDYDFCEESHYESIGASDQHWRSEWANFERSLKAEARFFSSTVANHLNAVFSGIETLRTCDGRPTVVDAGPGAAISAFFRARVLQSDAALIEALERPDLHLGSPPMVRANAGRMNAKGISVFYGASSAGVAIAEVRPPVGSRVAVARFEIARPLRLLDLTALRSVQTEGSIFDPDYIRALERAQFLDTLSRLMVQPVMPDDEAFDYLPTQVIADFLATRETPSIDGILFPSAQVEGDEINVVLFQKSAGVAELDLPQGTKITADLYWDTDEGPELNYRVSEEVSPVEEAKESPPAERPPGSAQLGSSSWPLDEVTSLGSDWTRSSALRIDPTSVMVHHVRRVKYECDEHSVSRTRFDKREPQF